MKVLQPGTPPFRFLRLRTHWFVFPLVCALAFVPGCASDREYAGFLRPPALVQQHGRDVLAGHDLDGDGRLDYVVRTRDGYADRLYFPESPRERLSQVVERPLRDTADQPFLLLMLDGVSFEHVAKLRQEGHFRLFREPVRVFSVFPSLTDIAYDAFMHTGPTPGYEAGFFDRDCNRMTNGFLTYLAGTNERWVKRVDYRIPVLEDAIMYLAPRAVFRSELARARRRIDTLFSAGRKSITIYFLSTDGIGHTLPPSQIRQQLIRLDAWIEQLVYDRGGQLEMAMLADHGNTQKRLASFDIRKVLRHSGLHPAERLRSPGDVAVPIFGLLDVARVHTYDLATRDRVVAALRERPEVDLLLVPEGERVRIIARDAVGQVCWRDSPTGPRFSYEPLCGDPLDYAGVLERLRDAGELDSDGFATAAAWLRASADAQYPAAPPRIRDAFTIRTCEQPEVVASLHDGWFVGSGLLAAFVTMWGTHGGLSRAASETFFCTTSVMPGHDIDLLEARDFVDQNFRAADGERSSSPIR